MLIMVIYSSHCSKPCFPNIWKVIWSILLSELDFEFQSNIFLISMKHDSLWEVSDFWNFCTISLVFFIVMMMMMLSMMSMIGETLSINHHNQLSQCLSSTNPSLSVDDDDDWWLWWWRLMMRMVMTIDDARAISWMIWKCAPGFKLKSSKCVHCVICALQTDSQSP